MARIRTIKPEFFTSEDIVDLSPLARLLYIATWCEADREGRLVWKPRTMKLRYFPADDCDIDALARELVASGLVVPYGDGLAFIPSFSRHQHVNPRESQSSLPNPDASVTRADASLPVSDAQVGREGKGREGEEEKQTNFVRSSSADDDGEASGVPPCPHQDIIAAYHEILPMLPGVREWTPARRTALAARWREKPERQTIAWWRKLFSYVAESDFLTGRVSRGRGHDAWQCSLPWLLKPENFAKLLEGHYENREVSA